MIDLEVTPTTNILRALTYDDDKFDAMLQWWRKFYDNPKVKGPPVKVAKMLLGPQNTTKQYTHRNWIWWNEEHGWVLFVSVRGYTLELIGEDVSAEETFKAFQHFTQTIDANLDQESV